MSEAWGQRNTYHPLLYIFISSVWRKVHKITDIVTPTIWRLEKTTVIAVVIRWCQTADGVFTNICDKLVPFAVNTESYNTVLEILWTIRANWHFASADARCSRVRTSCHPYTTMQNLPLPTLWCHPNPQAQKLTYSRQWLSESHILVFALAL